MAGLFFARFPQEDRAAIGSRPTAASIWRCLNRAGVMPDHAGDHAGSRPQGPPSRCFDPSGSSWRSCGRPLSCDGVECGGRSRRRDRRGGCRHHRRPERRDGAAVPPIRRRGAHTLQRVGWPPACGGRRRPSGRGRDSLSGSAEYGATRYNYTVVDNEPVLVDRRRGASSRSSLKLGATIAPTSSWSSRASGGTCAWRAARAVFLCNSCGRRSHVLRLCERGIACWR